MTRTEFALAKRSGWGRLTPVVMGGLAIALAISLNAPRAAWALEDGPSIDWNKLGLNDDQSKQIQSIEGSWEHEYGNLKPGLVEDQHKLARLLSAHNSDSVEIMALQSSIAQRREQLNALAVANYLKKKQVLSDSQQHTLELMMKQAIADRQRDASGNEEMPGRIQGLMQRVRNIWPVQSDR